MNILLSSAGRRSYLVNYFKNVLNEEVKVFVSNSDPLCASFQVADESVVTPLIFDKDYIPFLLDYCKMNQIRLVIPLFDVDVMILAKHRQEFQKIGTTVLTGDYDDISFCNDKYQTYLKLNENEILTPYTSISLEEITEKIVIGQVKFPLIVKPRWGMGSIGIYEAKNMEELNIFYQKTLIDIQESYLKYESQGNLNQSVLIQQKLDSVEYGLDVINDLDQNYQTTIVKKKIAMRAGETDIAETIENEQLNELGKKLSLLVKHRGNLDVDILFDGENYYVLELNARFGGGFPFSYIAGVDLPTAIIKWMKNENNGLELDATIGTIGFKELDIIKFDLENDNV